MGVLGLWQLLQPTSRPTKLQGLEGKILAIDISIWLHQATKGVRNSSNGHLLVLYNRICKLLFFKIKPIFVFDGPNVPRLKQRILRERQRRRNAAADKAKNLEDKIQKNLLETYALQNVLGQKSGEEISENIVAKTSKQTENDIDDLFVLPEKSNLMNTSNNEIFVDDSNDQIYSNDLLGYEPIDLDEIDKDVFDSLPDDIKFDILNEHKRKLKEKKSQSFEEFPRQSDEFSDFQMKLLLKKSNISNKINDLKKSVKSNYTIGTDYEDVYHQKVASEANQEVILFTRKSKINKFNAQSLLDSIHNQKNAHETETDDLINSDVIKQEIKEEPTFRIKFNIENNKIELVPTTSQKEEDNEKDIFEKYISIDQNYFIDKTEHDSNPNLNLTVQNTVENVDQEVFKSLPAEIKSDELVQNDKNFLKIIYEPISIFTADSDKSVDVKLVENLIKNTEIIKTASITSIKEVIEPIQLIDEIAQETDSDSDDDDFVEVKTNEEAEMIKEISNINKIHIESAKSSQLSNNHIDIQQTESVVNSEQDKKPTQTENIYQYLNDFDEYNLNLVHETNQLIRQKQNNDRLSNSIERYIIDDAKYLLRLFGLPFIDSPGEAEAQCAYLDYTNQTDGSITEDSDVWLFGAKRVYKNFFGTDQFIDFYSDTVIKSQLGLERETLIDVALLVGSDYTEGIENVGIVKAVEILNEFEGIGLEKLKNFKEWHLKLKENKSSKLTKIRQALSKLNLPDSFPSEIVYKAYMSPDIDKSTEEFSWSMPELDLIRKFLMKKMGWPVKKIDDDLLPIIKRLNEKAVQKTIENFFVYQTTSSFTKQSKRMKKAINLFRNKSDLNKSSNVKSKAAEINLSENEDEDEDLEVIEEKSVKQKKVDSTNMNTSDNDIEIIDENSNEKIHLSKRKSSASDLPNDKKKLTKSSIKKNNNLKKKK